MPSSTINKALSSTKSFIESFTSSDNPTTTFTEHTITSTTDNNGIVSKMLKFASQPKFKWYILGLLLCIVAFTYFKFQNKTKKTPAEHLNTEDTSVKSPDKDTDQSQTKEQKLNLILEERDKEWINKINSMKQQFNTQLVSQVDANTHLIAQLQTMQQQHAQQHPPQPPQPQPQPRQPSSHSKQSIFKQKQPIEHLSESSHSEEIFIEDKNVMEHNLTAEEMNAIDKQLEDVNLDHLIHVSD